MRGPPPFATLYNGPQAARRWRGLPGARGAARSRPRVALVCAALGPPRRNARRGVPKPSKVCAKNPHCGGQRAARPRGAARPVAPLGGFCARGPIRRHPLPPRLLVVVMGGSGFPPPAAGPAPRECRGREGFARSRPVAHSGLLPARFFSPAPCILAGGPAFSPSPWLALVVPALCMAARRGRAAPPLRAARYTEGAEDGGTNEGRRDRAGKPYRPPGGWFRALPASLLTLKALPHIGQYRQYSRTG